MFEVVSHIICVRAAWGMTGTKPVDNRCPDER